jgi:hypothetical protein
MFTHPYFCNIQIQIKRSPTVPLRHTAQPAHRRRATSTRRRARPGRSHSLVLAWWTFKDFLTFVYLSSFESNHQSNSQSNNSDKSMGLMKSCNHQPSSSSSSTSQSNSQLFMRQFRDSETPSARVRPDMGNGPLRMNLRNEEQWFQNTCGWEPSDSPVEWHEIGTL